MLIIGVSYRTQQKRSQAPTFFFAPPESVDGDVITLSGAEAKHATTVCRLKKGALITVADGEGNAYDCEISDTRRGVVHASVVRAHRRLGEPLVHMTLAVGVGRPATVDWIIEKAVELGVASIIPLRCAQSTGLGDTAAVKRRVSRWQRLALSAMKQCMRSVCPPISEMVDISAAVNLMDSYQVSFIADPEGTLAAEAAATHQQIMKAMLFVGPESGFSGDERDVIINAGARPFALGTRRLRAETAAMASITLLMRELGEL